jgi:hypothetical protein
MSEQAFTPGPWEASVLPYPHHPASYYYRITDPAGRVVAKTSPVGDPLTTGNEEANARLIAAAPELMEALADAAAVLALTAEQLRLWARESPDGPAMRRKADLLAAQTVALRGLIARAKGG